MISIADVLNPFIWGLAALGALAALFASSRRGRELLHTASALLAAGALVLLAAVAVAAWFPPQALLVRADGSTGDPRAVAAVILAIAALLGLVPPLRSLGLPALGTFSMLLPGIGIAGLVAVVGAFAGLRSPAAIAALAMAGVALGTGLALIARLRWSGLGMLAMQVAATGLLLTGAVLSLHGARVESVRLEEGAAVDTLGCRLALGAVQAPNDSLRLLEFTVVSGGRPSRVSAALAGRAGAESRAVVGGGLFGGPLVAPLGLDESAPRAHDLAWLAKGDSVRADAGTVVTFVGFRMLPGDTVRMMADLDVARAGRTERVSPGMYATSAGTTPFAAVSEALGPIAIGKVDADNGRIALMLPMPSATGARRTAIVALLTRPGLPVAWLGGALVVAAFLLGVVPPVGRADGSGRAAAH